MCVLPGALAMIVVIVLLDLNELFDGLAATRIWGLSGALTLLCLDSYARDAFRRRRLTGGLELQPSKP
jgi:hypothetical protein